MSEWRFLQPEIDSNDFIIDCRSLVAYQKKTIEGAYYFPFIKKAFGSDIESQKKMCTPLYKIVEMALEQDKDRIVVFDEGMGMFAARMTFLLRSAGFRETYILEKKWTENTAPTESGQNVLEFEIPKTKAKALQSVVDKGFMEKNLTRLQIFDVRTKEEYDGVRPRMTNPEPGTLCGRLPGAFLWDWRSLYVEGGVLTPKMAFKKKLQGFPFMPERTTVVYDYNGARSSLTALMLKEVGYQDLHTYQGSWFEWRKSNLPKQAVSLFGQSSRAQAAPRVGGFDKKK
ncbi:MAG: rhodanese-like domain-containing protein [Spirochaetota bacterium]